MGYGVCNIEKAKGDGMRLAQHIERVIYKTEKGEDGEKIVRVMDYTPSNVNKERTHLNKEYIPTDDYTLFERIDNRIKDALGDKKIRKDQVRYFDIVVSATYEDMVKIQEEGNLDLWCKMNTEWAQNFFGEENVVGATLHMDEKTPHMHIAVVPIVSGETRKRKLKQSKGEGEDRKYKKDLNRLRLSCDDMLSKDILKKMQTSHFETIGKVFGIKRGIEGSDAKHSTTREYYANIVREGINKIEEIDKTISKKDDELIKKNTELDEVKKQNSEITEGLKEHALEIIDSGILDIKEEGKSKEIRELIEADSQNENLSQNVKTVVDGVKDAAQAAKEKIEDLSAKETEIKLNIKSEAIDILESNILDVNGDGISENIKSRFVNDSQNEHVIENFNLVAVGLQETVQTLNNVITESQGIVDGLENKVKDLSAKENSIKEDIKKNTLEIIDSGILDIKEDGKSKEMRAIIEDDPHNDNITQNFKTVVDGVKDAAQAAKELSATNTQLNDNLKKQILDIMNSGILVHAGENTMNEVRTRVLNDPKGENIADTAMFTISKAIEAGKNIEEINSKIKSETVTLTDERDKQINSSLMIAGTSKADVMKNGILLAIDKTLANKDAITHTLTRPFATLLAELDFRPSEIIANRISDTINQRNEEGLQRLRTRFQLDHSTTKEEICTTIKEKAKYFDDVERYSSENKIIDNYVPHATFNMLSDELKKRIDTLVEKAKNDPQIDKKLENVATFLKVDMIQAVTDTLENKKKDMESKLEKIDNFNEGMDSIYEKIETTSTDLETKENDLKTIENKLGAYQEEKKFLDSIKNFKEKINSPAFPSTPALEYPKNPFDDCRVERIKKQHAVNPFDREDCFIIPVAQKETFDNILRLCQKNNEATITRHTNRVVDRLKTDVFADINKLKQNIDANVKQAVEINPIKNDLEKERESTNFYKKLAAVYRTHPEVASSMTEEKENELLTKGKTIVKALAEPFILLYHKLASNIVCEKAKSIANIIFGEKPEKTKDIELKKKMEETGDAPVNFKYNKETKSFHFEFHRDIVEQKVQEISEDTKNQKTKRKGMGM